ncbi:hypothetical protein B5E58_11010 [Tyzzerella sp. An114]|nr:hypothetical protein B5E58_11010 [Tyzzerella sp. An114]
MWYIMKKSLAIIYFSLFLLLTSCSLAKNSEYEKNNNTEMSKNEIPSSNTDEMLIYIQNQVQEDIEINGVFDDKRDEAINFLNKNYPNYFDNNETMEKTYYYGCYLSKGYSNYNIKEYTLLGVDVCNAIKDVYRGLDKVESDRTQLNLEFIKENLVRLE